MLVQAGAGEGSSIPDEEFKAAGAQLAGSAEQVWAEADLLLKVKEPILAEYGLLRQRQVLFTYLHLAASRACTEALLASRTTSIAYETVQTADGALPLLAPMSEVAGRLSAQVGAYHLMRSHGGRGVLMGGVPGVKPADVVVIGAGTAGYNAARVANGMGSSVTVLDVNISKLRLLDAEFAGQVRTRYSSAYELEGTVTRADLLIGAVLLPGAKAPKLISNSLVAQMKPGAVLVDISIDQGGCFEDSRPTTHDDPTFARARHAVLLRGEHAQRGAQDVDRGADQRDHAVRACTCRPWLAGGVPVGSRSGERSFDARWRAAVRTGGQPTWVCRSPIRRASAGGLVGLHQAGDDVGHRPGSAPP